MSKIVHDRSLYRNHGCRCEICTRANTEYMRRYRGSKKVRYSESSTLQSSWHVTGSDQARWWRNTSGLFDPLRKRQQPQKPYVHGHHWVVITDPAEIRRLDRRDGLV